MEVAKMFPMLGAFRNRKFSIKWQHRADEDFGKGKKSISGNRDNNNNSSALRIATRKID